MLPTMTSRSPPSGRCCAGAWRSLANASRTQTRRRSRDYRCRRWGSNPGPSGLKDAY
jgi:hypothetical protein